jgi:hypothetical protein
MNSYELSRAWFDFAFEHPEKISPNHAAIYFFAIEHCNRLGWKKKFGFPTQMAMDALGIKKHQTYIKYFNDLIEWGFFELVQKSLNQYSANIITIKTAIPKNGKALDKAIITHAAKQTEPNGQSNGQSTGQSNSSIDKPITNKPITNKQAIDLFESFWNAYNKKVGKKECMDKWAKLSLELQEQIILHVPKYVKSTPDAKYRKDPIRYLTKQLWLDEIAESKQQVTDTNLEDRILSNLQKQLDND